jgi:hypothetical protein
MTSAKRSNERRSAAGRPDDTAHETIAAGLERDRLEHRARRIERVLTALEERAVYRHAVTGITPTPLEHAIADFRRELGRVRRRLSELRARSNLGRT